MKKNKVGQTRWATGLMSSSSLQSWLVKCLTRRLLPCLNRSGKVTGRGNGWSRAQVCSLRHQKQIPPYREGERAERGEATLDEAAAALSLSRTTVRRLIATGILPARQICEYAPGSFDRKLSLHRKSIERPNGAEGGGRCLTIRSKMLFLYKDIG